MRTILFILMMMSFTSCVSEVRQEEQAEEFNPQRIQGENDREGMGMDEKGFIPE